MTITSILVFIVSTVLWVHLFASAMRTWDAWLIHERRRMEANHLLMLVLIMAIVLAVCLRFALFAPVYAAVWVLGIRLLFFIGLRAALKLGYRAGISEGA